MGDDEWNFPPLLVPPEQFIWPSGGQPELPIGPFIDDLWGANFDFLGQEGMQGDIFPDLNSLILQSETHQVCFGMITDLPAKVSFPYTPSCALRLPVRFTSSSSFDAPEIPGIQGQLSPREADIISTLLSEDGVELEMVCVSDPSNQGGSRKRNRTGGLKSGGCSLSVIVYGPEGRHDDIGSFLERFKCFLQDPVECSKNVRYRNPHRLSSAAVEQCPMTFDLIPQVSTVGRDPLQPESELLNLLNSVHDIAEADQVACIKTSLLSHQRQALTFLLQRENPELENGPWNLWKQDSINGSCVYVNQVTGRRQSHRPSVIRGGILADPMGLGKSLTMISLIGHDIDLSRDRPTLLVVPLPLLSTWDAQITEHIHDGVLKYHIHHGKSRLDDFDGYNMIITTYDTVLTEWKCRSRMGHSALFSKSWYRVILDEGHFIRNSNSARFKAVCSLDAECRWVVTGTPLQNSLADIGALLKFIRAKPYSDDRALNDDIYSVWKNGDEDEAIKRMRRLLGFVLLRRAPETITLPKRTDTPMPLDFNQQETVLYERVRDQVRTALHDALSDANAVTKRGTTSALQQINKMRMLCNLGPYYRSPEERACKVRKGVDKPSLALCSPVVKLEGGLKREEADDLVPTQGFRASAQCADCNIKSEDSDDSLLLKPTVISNGDEKSPLASPPSNAAELPTKTTALLSHLKTLSGDIKSIVFSHWTLALDIIQIGIKQSDISYVRYDGKMDLEQREASLRQFRDDPSVRVILMTLSSGAVGLNMAFASQVYLMDPAWNPTVEEQAIARVHRMGQKREVQTVRFFIKDSLEEHIIQVQNRKKDLAHCLLSPEDEILGNVETLLELQSIL